MSNPHRWNLITALGTAVVFAVACGAPAEDAPADEPMDAGALHDFTPPPPGVTGTPADDVTDPAAEDLPNPTPNVITNWGQLPDGREWGASAGMDVGPDGHVWAYDRCGGTGFGDGGNCQTNLMDPIVKFDRETGEPLESFGEGLFVAPHGLHVDSVGNVWVTDFAANEEGTVGHQVFKFSPEGEVLMTLGVAGQAGSEPGYFNQPNDVVTAPNGDIFVADGHSGQNQEPPPDATGRIIKFSADGEYIMEWGRIGNEPGEFRTPHAMVMDDEGRIFVADRGNHRIQIFDQEGNHLDSYYQHGRVSDVFITPDQQLYSIDSESTENSHPGWLNGVRIGPVDEDLVTAFVPPHDHPDRPMGAAGEGVAVDADGNIYAAEGPLSRPILDGALTKYTP